jgi:expansin
VKRVIVLALCLAGCGDSTAGDGGDGDPPPIDVGCTGDPQRHEGEGTYYDFADGSGNCSFPATPDDLMVAAMNHVDYASSAVCGACIDVTGPKGSVRVRVVDQCPGCPEGDVDLSPEAFDRIADRAAGRVPIAWTYVACDVTGPVVYHFKDGSNPYWTALQVRNHTYPIATFEATKASGERVTLQRADYNYFIAEGGLGDGPYTFHVTDVNGNTVEDGGVRLADDDDVAGTAQFPICGG